MALASSMSSSSLDRGSPSTDGRYAEDDEAPRAAVAGPDAGSPSLGGDGSLDAQLVNLGHPEEALSVDEEIVLPPPRRGIYLRGGVGHDLEDAVAAQGPAELELGAAGHGVVDLLPVGQDQSLAGEDGPHDGHVVFLSAAGRARLAGIERVSVGKAEAPCWAWGLRWWEKKEAMKRRVNK